jgi:hypothetical protein
MEIFSIAFLYLVSFQRGIMGPIPTPVALDMVILKLVLNNL